MTKNKLEELVRLHGSTVGTLRHVAYEHCGVPRDADPTILDGWLSERLGFAANCLGPRFGVGTTQQVLFALSYPLDRDHGSFFEKVTRSWAEYEANPFIRRDVSVSDSLLHTQSHPDEVFGGAVREPFEGPMDFFLRTRPSED